MLDVLPVRWDRNVGRTVEGSVDAERVPNAAETESPIARVGAAEMDDGATEPAREADGVRGRKVGGVGGRISHPNNADRTAASDGSVKRKTFSSVAEGEASLEAENSGSLTEFNAVMRECTCADVYICDTLD